MDKNFFILKAEVERNPNDLEVFRKKIIEQLKEGVVVIPFGFSYDFIKIGEEVVEAGKNINIPINIFNDLCKCAASFDELEELLLEYMELTQPQEGE